MISTLKFAHDLTFPVDAVTQTFGFIAKKRAGKSYAAGVLLEQFDRVGAQFGVLDPVGRHYGLRLAADGKGKGIDVVILGGLRGDIPLDPDSGKLVADAFCDTGRNFIMDVSQFSLSARKRFVTAFGEQLWLRQKALKDPRPMHIVLEEAQLFLPQQMVPGSEDARMVGIWTEIVRLGGNVGIGVSLITQRPQSVSKEALTQVECMIVLQVNGVPEKKSLKDWLVEQDGDIDLLKELPFLPQGTAYIWSPTWLQHFGKHKINAKWTFDASATPKMGVVRKQIDLPKLDLGELEKQMAASKQKGQENDPTALKRQVAELKKQLAEKAPAVCEVPKAKPPKEVPVFSEKDYQRLEKLLEKARGPVDLLTVQIRNVEEYLTKAVNGVLGHTTKGYVHPPGGRITPAPMMFKPSPKSEPLPQSIDEALTSHLGNSHKRILKGLATLAPMRLTTKQIATLADMTESGTFSNYVSSLRVAGFIEGRGELSITPSGSLFLARAGVEYDHPETVEQMKALWANSKHMPGTAMKMLDVAIDCYPNPISPAQIAEKVGMTQSGTFSNYMSTLRTNGLLIGRGDHNVANAAFFDPQARS